MARGVYGIVNMKRYRVYVGSSEDLLWRLVCHIDDLRRGVHASRSLQLDWDEDGPDAFVYVVFVVFEKSMTFRRYRDECERDIILDYKTDGIVVYNTQLPKVRDHSS